MTSNPIARRRLFAAALLGTTGLLLDGCGLMARQWRYRYRLTATLGRGGQTVQGSSVVEVVRRQVSNGIGGRINGEAVAVDVPGAGVLFVLLSSLDWGVDWALTIVHHAFSQQLGTTDMVNGEVLDRLDKMIGAKASVPAKYYPSMVKFRDSQDPATVEELAPADISARFGGFALQDLTIELTDESPRQTIYAKLPWLKTHKGALTYPDLNTPASEKPFSAKTTTTSFVMGSII